MTNARITLTQKFSITLVGKKNLISSASRACLRRSFSLLTSAVIMSVFCRLLLLVSAIFQSIYQGAPIRNRRNRSDIIRPSHEHSLVFFRVWCEPVYETPSSLNALFNIETATYPLLPTQYTLVSSANTYLRSHRGWKIAGK